MFSPHRFPQQFWLAKTVACLSLIAGIAITNAHAQSGPRLVGSGGVALQPFSLHPTRTTHHVYRPVDVAYYAPHAIPHASSRILNDDDNNVSGDSLQGGSRPMVNGDRAVLRHGVAYAPSNAPDRVKHAIWAVNSIVGRPYVWGGGHGSFNDRGYDCSG